MNSIGLYNSLANTNSALTSNSDQVANLDRVKSLNDVSKEKTPERDAGGSLNLSSRAQKLQAISSEFFSNDVFTQLDSKALTQRVYDYGLVNDGEYDILTSNSVVQSADNNQQAYNLVDYLQTVKGKLNVSDSEEADAVSNGISSAISVLSDVEKMKSSPTFKQDINNAIAQLTTLNQSDAFNSLEATEKDAMQSTLATLTVIDKISPQRLSNPYVNRYIDFSK